MKKYLKGISISLFLSLSMIFVLSILVSNTKFSESLIKPATMIITFISIFCRAYSVSKTKKEKGIVNGITMGIIYVGILYLISVILNYGFYLTLSSIIMIVIGMIGGLIGGVIGVNF